MWTKLKIGKADRDLAIISILIGALIVVFLLWPLFSVLFEAFITTGAFSLRNFERFFKTPFYVECLVNSLSMAVGVTLVCSIIAIPYAYLVVRTDIRFKGLFSIVPLISLLLPGYLASLGYIFALGTHGAVNLFLMQYLGLASPVNFIYNLSAVVFIESLELFALIFLLFSASLEAMDPSLEESASDLGAKGFTLFRTVTFPLALPGFMAGAIMVFIRAFDSITIPLILGFNRLMGPMAYQSVRGAAGVEMGVIAAVIMIVASMAMLLGVRRYVRRREYVFRGTRGMLVRPLKGVRRKLAYLFLLLITASIVVPHGMVVLASFSKKWGMTILPTEYTLDAYRHVIEVAPNLLVNTFLYSSLSTIACVVIGFLLAYSVTRGRFPGKDLIDSAVMIAYMTPAIALAVGYVRVFGKPLPFTDFILTWSWLVLPVIYTFRRLPFSMRSSIAALEQLDSTLEEASADLGATRWVTIRRIVVPLSIRGILAGASLTFIYIVKEATTTLFLTPSSSYGTIAFGIFEYYQSAAQYEIASALGVVMIIIMVAVVVLATRLLGVKFGSLMRIG